MKHRFPKTIKSRIMLLTVSITLLITLLLASISFYIFSSILEKNLIQTTEFSLKLVMDSITSDMNELIYLAKWCGSNKNIGDYLESEPDSPDYTKLQIETFDRLKEEYQNSKISEYIKRIVICDNNNNFIQVIGNAYDFYSPQVEELQKLPFYNTLLQSPTFTWIGVLTDPLAKNEPQQVIPVIRPIYSSYRSSRIGWVYITVSSDIVTDHFKNYNIPNDSEVMITIEKSVDNNPSNKISYQIDNETLIPLTNSYESYKYIEDVFISDNSIASRIHKQKNDSRTIVTYHSTLNGWSLSQSISREHLSEQRVLYYLIIFISCFVILLLSTCLLLYLNHSINKPIIKIRNKMNRIANGDFTIDKSMEWDNELGEIGKGINTLTLDIVTLMEKRIYDEKQKNELEYEILLSQINPHFLYNTLNSIKWMATIQNATGIADMVTSLAQLLKKVTKEKNKLITIQEELSMVEDYFYIQKYRYGGIITLDINITDRDIKACYIPKFTLQPLIENAIFHGIEPKGEPGHIQINSRILDEKRILIEIIDDGMGMPDEKITEVLGGFDEQSNSSFRKIGISNVNQRIKYTFGKEYGLSITSEACKYTKMSILIPYTNETEIGRNL